MTDPDPWRLRVVEDGLDFWKIEDGFGCQPTWSTLYRTKWGARRALKKWSKNY